MLMANKYRRHTHPMPNVCKPYFSEISTLYLGTNSQDHDDELDEFVEIAFPREHCKDKEMSIHKFNLMIIDTRPRTSERPALLFFASLYHKRMRKDTSFFVIGNQTDASKELHPPFDMIYGETTQDSSAQGISFRALHRTRGIAPVPSEEENSHYPVVFLIYERCTTSTVCKEIKEGMSECSYLQQHSARKMERKRGDYIAYVTNMQLVDLIFEHLVDVVVVSRNLSITRGTPFVQRLSRKLNDHDIKLNMIAISVQETTRDIVKGASLSFCPPRHDELDYRATHTSSFWKLSEHTPGLENKCESQYLRRFDEDVEYNSQLAVYRYPEGQQPRVIKTEDRPSTRTRSEDFDAPTNEETLLQVEKCVEGELQQAEQCEAVLQKPPFTHADLQSMATKVNYLYQEALSREKVNHEVALKNARDAMERYEESTRKNAFRREMRLILDTGDFDSDTMKEVPKLASKEFSYYMPVFGQEWRHQKRGVNIRCEPCFEALKERPDVAKSPLAKEEGIPIKKDVIKTLRNHHRGYTTHINAVKSYEQKIEKRISDYLATVDTSPNDPLSATARLFSLAYAAVKMYLPPFKFPDLCQAVKGLGVELGTKHLTQDGYVNMARVISEDMKGRLIRYIQKNQSPFSLLIDGSTDIGGKQILLVFIRFPDAVSLAPNTQLLEAIEINEAETGLNLFNAVYDIFARNHLIKELVWNLIAVATDGAKNMIAEGGLQGRLNANISQSRKNDLMIYGATNEELSKVSEKPIVWIHCLAHKVELALAEALKGEETSQSHKWRIFATNFLNKLHSFFGSVATKRRRKLERACRSLENCRLLKLKEIIEIRWASSEKDAIHNFLKMYKSLWLALHDISQSHDEFDKQTRTRAAAFLSVLKSIKLYRYLLFQLDLLSIIGDLSKKAQDQSSTIWATETEVSKTTSVLNNFADKPWESQVSSDFQNIVLCKLALGGGGFHFNARDDEKCRNWFWTGWEGDLNKEAVIFRLGDSKHIFQFSIEVPEGVDIDARLMEWEHRSSREISELLISTRHNLAQYITRGSSQHVNFNAEEARSMISDLEVLEEFKKAQLKQLDMFTRQTLTSAVAETLRKRLTYSADSILYKLNALSLKNIIEQETDADGRRRATSKFFGYHDDELDLYVRRLHKELVALQSTEVLHDITLAQERSEYFLPLLRKLMLTTPPKLTKCEKLLELLSKITAIPTNTAAVERGFSIYNLIKEARRSATSALNMDAYLRIVLNGPQDPTPYEFDYFTKLWKSMGHQLADDIAETRGPSSAQKASDERKKRLENIFSEKVFLSRLYFSEP
ncbi:unnamed protein product [Cylicocyclus nassatus]|uniref:Uncharacterized protein n=1 Tax=Cylicocyclus nassatus TaxID=53992 RepID=A0AA36DRG8_CYLNA|nr:unnamed protein product [Cylicocyclus nassatus]